MKGLVVVVVHVEASLRHGEKWNLFFSLSELKTHKEVRARVFCRCLKRKQKHVICRVGENERERAQSE